MSCQKWQLIFFVIILFCNFGLQTNKKNGKHKKLR